jgi:hypothetical protein
VRFLSLADRLPPGGALPEPHREAETDEHGRFGFDGFGAGDVYMCLRVETPGFLRAETWVGAGTHAIVLKVLPSRPLGGVVVDGATGEGIEGILVLVRPEGAGPLGPVHPAPTGAGGAFSLAGVAPGRYAVEAGAASFRPGDPAAAWIPAKVEGVEAGTTDLRIPLAKGLAISGTILDSGGRPPATPVAIQALGRTAEGGPDYSRYRWHVAGGPDPAAALAGGSGKPSDGTFSIPGLAPGIYDLTFTPVAKEGADPAAAAPATATTVRDVPAGTEGLVVRMREGKPLSGTLVDERGDPVKAVASVYVYLPDGGPTGLPVATVASKGDGTFATAPLDEGRAYDVLVTNCEGRVPVRAKGVFAGDPGLRIVLPEGAAISGTVRDPAGKPVGAGVPVSARAPAADPTKPGSGTVAYTDAAGAFRLDGLGPHVFSLVAGGGESPWAPGPSREGVAQGAKGVDLAVRAGVTLSGTLLDASGKALKTHYLSGSGAGAYGGVASWTRVEAEDGRFTLRGLPPGKVRLACYRGAEYVPLGEYEAPGEGVVVRVP